MIQTQETQSPVSGTPLAPFAKGDPIVGSLLRFFMNKPEFLRRLSLEYGDVVRFKLGPITFHFLSRPEHIKYVYENPDLFDKDTDAFRQMGTWLGSGLSTNPGGASWKRHRRFAQPGFMRPKLAALSDVITAAIEDQLRSFADAADTNRAIDVHYEMRRSSLRVVGEALLSINLTGEYADIGRAFADCSEEAGFRAMQPFRFVDALPLKRNRQYRHDVKFLDQVMYDMIRRRREHGQPRPDLLALLMEAKEEATGDVMNDEELCDEVKTFFAAGQFTTAAALNWTLYSLVRRRDLFEQVRAETDQVFGDGSVKFEHLQQLDLTRRCIQEALRLYPPSWIISRRVAQDATIGGFHLPANDQIMISSFVTHRHPEFWTLPEQFDPDRFLADRAPKANSYVYFPFGGGPRICIGSAFAMMEMQTIIATLIQRYDFELSPTHRLEFDPGLSLRPRRGMFMKIFRRRRN